MQEQSQTDAQSLKDFLTEFFSKAETRTLNLFFWSEANESSAEDHYPDEEARDNFYELLNNKIIIKNEDSYGGEGQGEDYWSVYSFTKGGEKVYVKFKGWYQSYTGPEYDEWFFIEPKEVLVTQFVKI